MGNYNYIQILIVIMVAFIGYAFLVRPQLKRLNIHRDFIHSLKNGDTVITSGGLIGKIVSMDNNDLLKIEFSDSVYFNVLRNTVQSKFEF